MALTDVRLTLLAFAQGWDGASLRGTLLLIPSGDPSAPLLQGATKPFQGTTIALRTALVPGTDSFASTTAASLPFQPAAPLNLANAPDIFTYLAGRFSPTDQTATPVKQTSARIRKALPDSYTNLLPPGATRSAFAASPDDFSCALKGQQIAPPPPNRPAPSWGEVISYALRNRSLASALGLSIEFTVPVAKPADFASGGWLFVTLDASDGGTGYWNAWAAKPDLVKCYAALLPPLGAARSLFTPVLFPVQNPASPPMTPDGATLDLAFIEATTYSDGFARIVHARQPVSSDAATGAGGTTANPASDAGIQIGWDDEQVLEWHNRQIAIAQAVAGNLPVALEAPLGVMGYRLDVREPVPGEPQNPPSNSGWASLMTATATVPPALQGKVPAFAGELAIEPTASIATVDRQTFWLPLYFAQWRGVQLGIRDDVARLLAGGVAAGKSPQLPASAFTGTAAPRLLYGHTYQFRVRLTDMTGGGPDTTMRPAGETSGQRAQVTFAREVPPKNFKMTPTAEPGAAPLPPLVSAIALTRPTISYPEALFTPRYGSDPLVAQAATTVLLAQLGYDVQGKPPAGPPPKNAVLATGLPDPDVQRVRITVEARVLARDNATDVSADGAFVAIYTTFRDIPALPAIDPNGALGPAEILADTPIPPIALVYQDVADIADLQPQGAVTSGPLVLPTARDVRLILTPIADGPMGYFGSADAASGRIDPRVGITSKIITRSASTAEADLFVAVPDGKPELQALFFQPVPAGDVVAGIMSRMATQLNLLPEGLTLSGPPGERVVFGCSAGFKHQIAPDGSSLTFASASELLSKWSVVYQIRLARDWTWDGLQGDQLLAFGNGGAQIASIAMPRIASVDALAGVPDRTFTRVVLIHAIDPTVPNTVDGFSNRPPIWLRAQVPIGGAVSDIDSDPRQIRLPVVVPPASNPEVVSAGYALSPYGAAVDYSSTVPRERRLWLELKTPPVDGDGLFVRVDR